jgi:glycosyltransferase involved in cell wall biosynthesis
MDSLTISLLSDKFKKLKNDLNIDGVCLVQFPGWAELVLELKNLFNYKVIFDILDDFTEFPNIPKTRIIQEKLLAQNSDIVLTTSSILEEKAKTFSENVLFLPNACEFSHFNKSINDNFLGNYKKPIIGYFGAIAEWFDVELIEYVVRNRPDFSYVFIGLTAGADIRKLEKYENVHFLGEHAYSELPNYLHGFDACLIPFKRNKLIESTHPVKIYEYLSAGKPTICTNLPELNSMKNLCYIANDKEEFLRMLDSALNEKDKNIIKKRIDFSSKNTWHDRFTKLYDNMEKIPDLRLDEHIKQIK